MEDKVYILSDGRERTVSSDEEAAFQAELREKGLTATLKSDESGNQISSTEDATVEQDNTASNQEADLSQNNQQQDTEFKSEDTSSDSPSNDSVDESALMDDIAKIRLTEQEKQNIHNISNDQVDNYYDQVYALQVQESSLNIELDDINSPIDKIYQTIVQDTAFNDYLVDNDLLDGYNKLNPQKQLERKIEIFKSETFNIKLDNYKEEANKIKSDRSKLKQQLNSGQIDQETYNDTLDQINEVDKYHNRFSQMNIDGNIFEEINRKVDEELDGERGRDRKKLYEESKEKFEEINLEVENAMVKYEILTEDVMNTFQEADLYTKELSDLEKKIHSIKNTEYMTQEDADKASKELKLLGDEYLTKFEARKILSKNAQATLTNAKAQQAVLESLISDQSILKEYVDASKRSQSTLAMMGVLAASGAIDMAQGIYHVGDMMYESYNGILNRMEDGFLKSAFKVLPYVVNPVGTMQVEAIYGDNIVDEDGNVTSRFDQVTDAIDDWQEEELLTLVKEPLAYGDIDSFSDGAEWFAGMFAQQIPIFATLAATGGAGLAVIGATTLGQEYDANKDEALLYDETNGIYGTNMSQVDMVLNASIKAGAEVLSEIVTLGTIGGSMSRTIKAMSKVDLDSAVKNYLTKSVFNTKNAIGVISEGMEEAVGESLAAISGNLADMMVGKEGVGIFDGVEEAAVSGGFISGTLQAPGIIADLATSPFTSSSAQDKRNQLSDELTRIQSEINELTKSNDPNAKQKITELKNQHKQVAEKSLEILNQEIKKVDLLQNYEKSALIEIDKKNRVDAKKVDEIQADQKLTREEKAQKIKELENNINSRNNRKNQILNRYDEKAVNENYDRQVDAIKRTAELAKEMGGVDVNTTSKNETDYNNAVSKDQTNMSESQIEDATMINEAVVESAEQIVRDPKSTKAEIADAKNIIQRAKTEVNIGASVINNNNSYGAMIPQIVDGNLTRMNIVLNKKKAIKDGKINTPAHEFVHAVMKNTLRGDPQMRQVIGKQMKKILEGKGIKFKPGKLNEFNKRVANYPNDQKGEEMVAIASEMMFDGDLNMNGGVLTKLTDVFRRFTQNVMGYDIKLDTTQDLKNFLKDYHLSISKNKPSPAIAKMLAKGANGKIFNDARTEAQIKQEASFSQAVDLNRRSNPDLKSEFDNLVKNSDGNKKFDNNDMFKNSSEYYEAYTKIVDGKSLDGLIQQGMTELGLPPAALKEFTRKVKEKLGDRFIDNFDITKNDSLFGWLTGVSGGAGRSIIFRAKGDVMKEYKKEEQAKTTSIDKDLGDGARLSDIIKDDRDVYLDAIENADLTPGIKQSAIEAVNELKAKEILEFSNDVNQSIKETVQDAKLDLENLTYKGVKPLLTNTDSKVTSEKKATPTGVLFPVLNGVATEFGIDPLRILANQDLNADQRKAAQKYIFDKATKPDGSFDTKLLDILPEGETRSGEATGVANTKLGQLYKTGARVKVSEGAKKDLGQKRSQTKRTDVTRTEFLDLFGINSDGTLQPGTKADGAIRALVVQTAQTVANQEIRIDAYTNGSTLESVIVKLSDGKSEAMFNKDSSNQATIENGWGQVIEEVSVAQGDAMLTDNALNNIIDNVYGETLSNANKKKAVNKIKEQLKDFFNVSEAFGKDFDTVLPEFLANEFYMQSDKNTLLDIKKILQLNENPGNRLNSKDGLTKQREHFQRTIEEMHIKFDAVDAAVLAYTHLSEAAAGSGKLGGNQFIPTKNGSVDVKINPEKGTRTDNRYKYIQNVSDKLALINNAAVPKNPETNTWVKETGKGKIEVWDGKMWIPSNYFKRKVTLLKENSEAALKDRDGATRIEQSNDARLVAKIQLDLAWKRVNDSKDSFDIVDFGALIMNLGSGMNSPLRKAAPMVAIQKNINKVIAEGKKKGLGVNQSTQYEHSISKAEINRRIIESYQKNGELKIDEVFKDYEVHIISKSLDDAQNAAGYKTKSPAEGRRSTDVKTLYELSKAIIRGDASISDISTLESIRPDGDTKLETDTKIAENIVKKLVKLKVNDLKVESIRKNTKNKNSYSKDTEAKGMSTFDFDETLIIKGENFVVATNPNTGKVEKISSDKWPTRGPQLAKEGYEFNFDDFVNVRGGVNGPLFQKLKNRIEKYGPDNNFILTARPMESAVAIHGWLKSKGINIPLTNITGLADSRGEAKAEWMMDKFAEGYNDMYFVDDALPNVKAVKEVLDQLDIKSNVVQAKMNLNDQGSLEFNEMLERTKGVGKEKTFSTQEARQRGKNKGRFDFFVPPSAEDFKGLVYKFLGKGKQGDADLKWFKENLFDPFSKGTRAFNTYKQKMADEYSQLKKEFPNVKKSLHEKVKGTNFTNDHAVRVYLWNKNGIDIPGLAETTKKKLIDSVIKNKETVAFAETLSKITRIPEGYTTPSDYWNVETIASDLSNTVNKVGRKEFLSDWIHNKNTIFSETNLNKIEAVYGVDFRDALENMLYRMENGTNRLQGKDKHVNRLLNWINGSVGAVMFFNIRSAALQTISTVNFMNWSDNNPFNAAKAFANVPQFSKDFATIFNSDMLKQRRAGLQIDVSASELTNVFNNSQGKPQAVISWLLEKGFAPTRIADSFAISMGGASFYRNRINKYVKEGMNQKNAEKQAFLDFQEIAEETQQSSRPDLVSQQQAGTLGRIILAWQNTPMQMTRLTKKALSDIVNRRGDMKSNISKVLYYGAIQNIIFGSLQSGLAWLMFGGDDEEDEKMKDRQQRVANGALDTLLRGTGIYGAAAATLKNTIIQWDKQRKKPYGRKDYSKVAEDIISFSPPMGSKLRKVMSAIKTYDFNKGVPEKMGWRIDNPAFNIAGNIIEAATNVPIARIINKANNLEEAITGNHQMWQRVALVSGWDKWSLGIKDEELEQAKIDVKEERKEEKKKIKEQKKLEEQKAEEERKKKEGIKTVQCSGIRSNGQRCGLTTETKANSWTCHHHKSYKPNEETDTDGDGVKEVQYTATTGSGKRCRNRTENKNKKCYAHQ